MENKKLLEMFAIQAMNALISKDFSPNPWEIAHKSWDLADCMMEVYEERLKNEGSPQKTMF